MIFKIGLPAPHGGILVVPVVEGNPLLYILSILVGSVVVCSNNRLLKETCK